MNFLKTVGFLIMLVSMLATSAIAADLQNDLEIVSVELDDDIIAEDDVNRVDFERGDIIKVEVRLRSDLNLSDVEILAQISGYEFNDIEPMSDTSDIFDMESGVTYKKTLNIRVPIEVEEDDYKLRLYITDRFSGAKVSNYNLKLDSPRHGFQIEDVVFSPGNVVEAGRVLLTTVRVENKGERDEDSVKVSVSIPELGLSASDFIDEVEYEDSETSEEMYMRIPSCAAPGDYTVLVEVRYNELRDSIVEKGIITVLDGDACSLLADSEDDSPRTVIALGATSQELVVGEAGALYPLTINNEGSQPKAYTVMVDGTNDFASVQVNPVNTFVLNGGESQAVFLYLTANEDATPGERVFTVTVASGTEVLKQIPLSAVVSGEDNGKSGSSGSTGNLRNALEIGLIVLVVILIILGIIVGINKISKDDDDMDDDEVEGKTYY